MSDTEPVAWSTPGKSRSRELQAGWILDGRYEILERIGAGGMGVVYKARRLMLDDPVAVKQLAPITGSKQDPSRFLLEARAAAHIRHPNVVEIFDFGNPEGGDPYIVMEYLEGPTLEQHLRDGALSVSRALSVLAPICAAVEAGHRRGIIHRDLKPANIILTTSDDGREVVKVLDFGLARFDDSDQPRMTRSGAIIGTARYMSPEQARGEEVLPASDVFSLGILLYEMVTGLPPFRGKSPVMTALAISKGHYQLAEKMVPELPPPLARAIDLALNLDPSQRPATPEQLARLAEAGLPRPAVDIPRGDAPSRNDSGNEVSSLVAPSFDHFIGRERQLRRLEEEFEKSASGNGRVVLIIGESGIGKTRLVERFLEKLRRRQAAEILRGRFFDYEGSRPPPFETFLRMLRSDSSHDPSSDPVRQALEAEPNLEVESQRWRTFTALAEAIAARAGTSPLVLALDDVHWATSADLTLIDHLHRVLGHRGTLILATAQESEALAARQVSGFGGFQLPSEAEFQTVRMASAPRPAEAELARWLERLAKRRAHTVLTLTPFGQQEVREWFERGFGSLNIHSNDLKRIARISGANPYCLVEIARHLMDTGMIIRSSDSRGWNCRPLAAVELPETIVSLVRARLAELSPDLRGLLEVAAVIGGEIRLETLRQASGLDDEQLDRLTDEAVGLMLVSDRGVSPGNDLRFANETLRQVLYRDMSRRHRLSAHRNVVSALATLYQDNLERLAPVLAYHYHAIGDWPDALSWGIRALAEALDHSDNDAAEEALVRTQDAAAAATSVPTADRDRLERLSGTLYRRLGKLEDAIPALRSAQRSADPSISTAAMLELAGCHMARGDLDAALDTARATRRSAHRLGDRHRELEARKFEASCLLRLGLHQEAAAMLERLLATLDDNDSPALHSLIHRERAWALLKLGSFHQAQDHVRRAVALARESGDLLAQHHAVSALAAVLGESGDSVGSMPYHRRALELSRRLSLRRREAIDLANLGERLYETSDPDQALEHFHSALQIFIEIGDRACEGDCRVNVGRALLARGDTAEALAMLEHGRKICESIGRTEYAGLGALYEGEAHLLTEDPQAAITSFARAQDHFAQIDSHHLWRAHFGRAKAERAAGRRRPALDFVRAAAEKAKSQRTRLPAEADAGGFDHAASGVFELLKELEPVSPTTAGDDTNDGS